MAEVIAIRVGVFFVAFFALRPVMFMLIERPNRTHGLVLLGVSTLIAFVVAAVVVGDPLGEMLPTWFVIFVIIAGLWILRWKGQEWDRIRRRSEGLPEERYGPSDPRRD